MSEHGNEQGTPTVTDTGGSAPATPAPAPSSTDDYFNSTRIKVIGLITAGVVAVGALGGLAGVVFDPEPSDKTKVVQPGSDSGLGAPGDSVVFRASAGSLLRADGTSPSPVGSATPGDESESPVSESADPSPSATTDPVDPGGGSEGVTLTNGVQIYVPSGWQVDYQDDVQTNLSDGQGNWAYAYSAGTVDTAGDAGGLITANMEGLLPPDYYTQLQTSEIGAIEPFGSVVSVAYLDYEALWTDGQGAVSLHGQIYSGIRQDGTPLIVLVEHAPAEDWDAGFEQVKDIVNATFTRFSGLG